MKHLNLFKTKAEANAAVYDENNTPNVSYCEEDGSVIYFDIRDDKELEILLIDGEEEFKINTHSNVSVAKANAIAIVTINRPEIRDITYKISNKTSILKEEGMAWEVGSTIVEGNINLNTVGYSEFNSPIIFETGKRYQVEVIIYDIYKNIILTEKIDIEGGFEEVEE